MGVFCDRLKFGSTAALNCPTGQNKGRYCKKKARLIGVVHASLPKWPTNMFLPVWPSRQQELRAYCPYIYAE